jgi:hypothetical protein
MRKSLGEYTPVVPSTGGRAVNSSETGFSSSFGHPLDMLARTATNAHSPNLDRFTSGITFNGIVPPSQNDARNATRRIGPPEAIPTTWSTELSGIDPVERGWIDIDDAKFYFERYLYLPQ